MAQQLINIGAAPNDGTGDTLRAAMAKINANSTELYSFDSQWSVSKDVLLADVRGYEFFTAGDTVQTVSEGYIYEIAAAGATDHHVTTAGAVKLYVKPINGVYTLDSFNAVGDGVADDTAAIEAMTDAGRAAGSLEFQARAGATYTTTKPRLFAGIAYQKHFWNGAKLMNTRGTSVAETGFTANYESGMILPYVFDENGKGDGIGGYVYGQKIATVSVGSFDIVVTDPISNEGIEAGADVLIYGCATRDNGYPPDPRIFEYAKIKSVSGSTVTLFNPIVNSYRSDWPDVPNGHGAARIISCQRPNFTAIQRLEINDLHVAANPNWTTTAAIANNGDRNGRPTIGGYITCTLNNMTSDGGFYLSQGATMKVNDCYIRAAIEPDKCVDYCEINNHRGGKIQGGTGINRLVLNNPEFSDFCNLSPIDTLEINGGRLHFTRNTRELMRPETGIRRVFIKDALFQATEATQDAVIGAFLVPSANFTVNSDTQLQLSISDYYSDQISRTVHENMVLEKDGKPAFKVTGTPYQLGVNMIFDGVSIQPLTGTETLVSTIIREVETQGIEIIGPNAQQIRTMANRNFSTQTSTTSVISEFETPDFIKAVDPHIAFADSSLYRVTRDCSIRQIVVNVTVPYTGTDASAILRVRNYTNASATYATINLKEAGRRVINLSGNYGLLTGDSAALASDAMQVWRIDRTASLTGTQGQLPKWSVRMDVDRSF